MEHSPGIEEALNALIVNKEDDFTKIYPNLLNEKSNTQGKK